MKPKSKPMRTREESLAIAKEFGLNDEVFLLGERGYYLDSMGKPQVNDRGVYDDKIGLVWPAGHANFNANTDSTGYRKGKGTGSAKGVANLRPGIWTYKIGKHGISRGTPYTALVQGGAVTVERDGSPNYNDTGWFGINIHRGGVNTTSSLGCQTIVPEQWDSFIAQVQAVMRQYGLKTIKYLLIENTPERNKGAAPTNPEVKPIPVVNGPYEKLFNSMQIRSDWKTRANAKADRVLANKARYDLVAKSTGVPWHVIGIIHLMESDCNFRTHLHNGDPLTARTRQVPKGRPTTGNPPFTWEVSAVDALAYDSIKPPMMTIESQLAAFERINGFGYRKKGINTPYLWSGSNHYTKGKYVKDGVYSSTAVSGQVGAAVVLKILRDRGLV